MIKNSLALMFVSCNLFASDLILNPKFEAKIQSMVTKDIPYISISDAKKNKSAIFIDSREKNEYLTSHLPEAIFAGYDDIDLDELILKLDLTKSYIVYCSVGYRSSHITKKLVSKGFKAKNLYGGIFEWVNQKNLVYNAKGVAEKVHTFNKDWSQWLDRGTAVY